MAKFVVVSSSLGCSEDKLNEGWQLKTADDSQQLPALVEDAQLCVVDSNSAGNTESKSKMFALLAEKNIHSLVVVRDPADYPLLKPFISERLEAYPAELLDQLYGRVSSLCTALSAEEQLTEMQNQLVRSEKMAALGQLAAGVAHEINNPLGFISSNMNLLGRYSSMIRDEMTSLEEFLAKEETGMAVLQYNIWKSESKFTQCMEDVDEVIEESKDGLVRMREIVRDLKEYTHIGNQSFEATDINKLLNSTVNLLRNEIKYKANVNFDLEEVGVIDAIPSQLSQVFVNIIMNACQAIEDFGDLTIATEASGDSVEISIKDTGTGIEKEQLEKVFEPFFTTKPVGKGTGIGLAITRSIVERHAGSIRVYSMVGEGTTFVVRLPIHQQQTDEASVEFE
ncbi:sensor histidine kinase [Reinekea marinisedimentorum]|uniref:histidine kinase n=1 Tax=Reinekea marinisedimentorum TaxID=230495 RepID=A0A4R3I6I5_9GAMM|nr:ATP-binding protein [Reinekea marinisedimentorum]TCS40680.1 phospho-acceptor domain-containing protein [Reinekea marinisedimentorum]